MKSGGSGPFSPLTPANEGAASQRREFNTSALDFG
jgi:hypothetical protein